MLYRLITISETLFNSYFNCIFLLFCVNKYIITETSRTFCLWINDKDNPFNLTFFIVLWSHVLTIQRDEDDRSHLQVVISSFNVKCIFRKATESTLFIITGTESGKLVFNFAQSKILNRRTNSASRPLKFEKIS